MKLYDRKGAISLEREVIASGSPGFLLMMRAGLAIWDQIKQTGRKRIWAFIGPGNNGGDALIAACFAKLEGCEVTCIKTDVTSIKNDSQLAMNFSKNIGLSITNRTPSLKHFGSQDYIIDGLLGIGISRSPEDDILDSINFINSAKEKDASVISVDIPSGLNPNTGMPFGKSVRADMTLMLLTQKQGCYTGLAADYVGHLLFDNLGTSNHETKECSSAILLSSKTFDLKPRSPIKHKCSTGKVLILGGWGEMQGAGFLAGLAAVKAGTGKVFICTPNLSSRPMELIGIKPDLNSFKSSLEDVDAVVAGSGLTVLAEKHLDILWSSDIPLVFDAFALRWLAKHKPKKRNGYWIGTPHSEEARVLLGTNELTKDRFTEINLLHERYGGKWILKGPGTLVGPNPTFINNFSNSILATGGTGDILAGIAGAFLAQNCIMPAELATFIHTSAAKKILEENSSRIAASELLSKIGVAINELETKSKENRISN